MTYEENAVCILAAEVLLGMRGGYEVSYGAGMPWHTFDERRCSLTVTYAHEDGDSVYKAHVKETEWAALLADVAAGGTAGRDERHAAKKASQ